jgi:hypothetical protein
MDPKMVTSQISREPRRQSISINLDLDIPQTLITKLLIQSDHQQHNHSQNIATCNMSQVKKQPIVQDVQESAKRQVSEVVRVGEDAISSGAWMYPIQVSSRSWSPAAISPD